MGNRVKNVDIKRIKNPLTGHKNNRPLPTSQELHDSRRKFNPSKNVKKQLGI